MLTESERQTLEDCRAACMAVTWAREEYFRIVTMCDNLKAICYEKVGGRPSDHSTLDAMVIKRDQAHNALKNAREKYYAKIDESEMIFSRIKAEGHGKHADFAWLYYAMGFNMIQCARMMEVTRTTIYRWKDDLMKNVTPM